MIGPLTNILWAFSGSGEVYLGNSGEITQTSPGGSPQTIGYSIDSDTILIK
jgi:hypothetical protein